MWIYQILTSSGYMIYIPGLTSKSKKHPTLVHNQSYEKRPKELVLLYNHGSQFLFFLNNSNNDPYNLWSLFWFFHENSWFSPELAILLILKYF